MKSTDFESVPASMAGARITLTTPSGVNTEEWLEIYGPDSDAVMDAEADFLRDAAQLTGIQPASKLERLSRSLLAAYGARVISAWSFTAEEFTPEAVQRFLENAPVIAIAVRKCVMDRTGFFAAASTSSSSGPTQSDASVEEAAKS